MEHSCRERKLWYYQHAMWWHVKDLQKEVEEKEQAFKTFYNKFQSELDEHKEQMMLLEDTNSDCFWFIIN